MMIDEKVVSALQMADINQSQSIINWAVIINVRRKQISREKLTYRAKTRFPSGVNWFKCDSETTSQYRNRSVRRPDRLRLCSRWHMWRPHLSFGLSMRKRSRQLGSQSRGQSISRLLDRLLPNNDRRTNLGLDPIFVLVLCTNGSGWH